MPNIEQDRWELALSRVASVEQKSKLLKWKFLPRKFMYARRSAWSTQAGFDALPADQQHEKPHLGYTRARVRAESVLIGKFDVDAEVRLRAFYPKNNLSIRYQTGGQQNGIASTIQAHKRVHPHAPELMPTIHEDGTILNGQGAYLIEDTVIGKTPSMTELAEIVRPLTARLHRVHEGIGITDQHLSKIVGGSYRPRWTNFATANDIDPRLNKAVQRLIDRNDLLEVSLTHGDLVNSNILVNSQNFILVDWEYSRLNPIAFDMAKIVINMHDLDQTLQDVSAGFHSNVGTRPGHYTLPEQIALALVLTLSWHKNHKAKATIARRLDALERQTTKRVATLAKLLDV